MAMKDMKSMENMFKADRKMMHKAANVIHFEKTKDYYKIIIDLRAFDNNENNVQVLTNGNILTIRGRSIRKSKNNEQISEFQQNYMFGENVKLNDLTKETDGNYYVVYQEDKSEGIYPSIQENKKHINEAFKSNQLRQWLKEHGGVKNRYNDEQYSDLIDKRVMQDGLGDVSDDMILYTEEFNNYNEALHKKRQLKRSNPYTRQRSDWDMKAYFTVYQANDGTYLLVGLDRSKIKTGSTWGGELTKKTADRVMNNGWNFKTRSNRYVDDSDTYYYGKKAQDFGLRSNQDFKGKQSDNKQIRTQMSDAEWKEYMNNRIEHMQDYLNRHYPKKK